jgi:hypothetical protein
MGLALRPPVRFPTLLLVISLSGCVGDLVDITTAPPKDGGGGGNADLTTPTGGADQGGTPQAAKFNPTINNDIQGCTAGACHGGTQIPILKTGTDAATITANYTSFKAEAAKGAGENSPVLLKNLAGSGVTHGGGSPFGSKTDATYVRWLAWINAGTPE